MSKSNEQLRSINSNQYNYYHVTLKACKNKDVFQLGSCKLEKDLNEKINQYEYQKKCDSDCDQLTDNAVISEDESYKEFRRKNAPNRYMFKNRQNRSINSNKPITKKFTNENINNQGSSLLENELNEKIIQHEFQTKNDRIDNSDCDQLTDDKKFENTNIKISKQELNINSKLVTFDVANIAVDFKNFNQEIQKKLAAEQLNQIPNDQITKDLIYFVINYQPDNIILLDDDLKYQQIGQQIEDEQDLNYLLTKLNINVLESDTFCKYIISLINPQHYEDIPLRLQNENMKEKFENQNSKDKDINDLEKARDLEN